MTIAKTIVTALAVVAVLGVPAQADTSSHAGIRAAIATDSPEAIAGELENAEFLVCGGCIETVMALLDHPEYAVREVAAWWFTRRPAQEKELAERSIAAQYGSDSIAARNGADILGAFERSSAIPALANAVVRTDLSVEARAAAAKALGLIAHRDANPALSLAMQDTDATVRAAAVHSWLNIRRQQGAAPVVALVGDTNTDVRRGAAAIIGEFREASARTELEARLASDSDTLVRRNAAWALGRIGDPASRQVLEAARYDESGLVRSVARAALGQLR